MIKWVTYANHAALSFTFSVVPLLSIANNRNHVYDYFEHIFDTADAYTMTPN